MQTLYWELDDERATLLNPIMDDTPEAIAPTHPLLAFLPDVIHTDYLDVNGVLHWNPRHYNKCNILNNITLGG